MKKVFEYIYDKIKAMRMEETNLCRLYSIKLEKLKANYTDAAAMEMLRDNIEWMVTMNIINGEELRSLSLDFEFAKHDFYFEGNVLVKDAKAVLFGTANAKISGHSLVKMFEDSKCDADDSGFIIAFDNANVTAKNCKVVAFGNSTVTSRGLCLIENYDKTVTVNSTHRDFVY